MITLNINGTDHKLDIAADTPLLWALRDHLHLTGTKFGCGMALCGACTVHVDGDAVRSCSAPVVSLLGKKIVTIEGLAEAAGRDLHPVQEAWIEKDVVQCGYCHSGQIMSAAALLAKISNPSAEDVEAAMSGNICRCGTYERIKAGISRASELLRQA